MLYALDVVTSGRAGLLEEFRDDITRAASRYAVMTGRSPVGLPMCDPYPPELVEAVQERAWQIVRDLKPDRIVVKPWSQGLPSGPRRLAPLAPSGGPDRCPEGDGASADVGTYRRLQLAGRE
jgi:hypothetical protein